jgi:hypothetical protein
MHCCSPRSRRAGCTWIRRAEWYPPSSPAACPASAPATTTTSVTVNGRIAAVGATFDLSGTQSFAIVVPDKLLHEGRNDVRAFALN